MASKSCTWLVEKLKKMTSKSFAAVESFLVD
jgi:hypothetical protein